MKKTGTNLLLRAGLLIAAFLAANASTVNCAWAQSTAAPATAPAATSTAAIGAPGELDEIVVTGTNIKQTIMQTSFAVTVADQEALKNSSAIGLAALLTTIPGFYGEASAGENNLNISARGVRGGFLEYISLQEDGLPIVYNGFLEELEMRRDLTYGEMEVTRGGPSGVLTSNGAAAIVNFLSRKATDTPEGEVAVSYYTYGEVRTDLFYGGPIGNSGDTTGTIGGYYRHGDGVKNVGYDANDGGQFRATLTHKFDDSTSLMVTYKHIDDHSQFYLPQPVQISQQGGIQRITPITGFNAKTDYLQGSEMELVNVKSPNGDGQAINLKDGIWEKSDTVTFIFSHDWQNEFRLNDSVRIAKIQTIDNDLRNLGGNSQIQTASSFLSTGNPLVSNLLSTFAPQGAVGAQLVRVDSGAAVANPAAMNGNGLVTQMGANQFSQNIKQVINDAQLLWHTDKNNATLGLLSWRVDMDVSQNGVNFLMDVTNRAHLLDVAAVNAAGQVVGHLTDNGVLQYDTGYANGTVNIKSNSIYLNDQFQPIDPLRVDAGVRFEKVDYTSLSENTASNVPLSGVLNPGVIADQAAAGYGTGTYTNGRKDLSGTSWTTGANYQFNDNLAVYGRYSSAIDTGIANFAVFCSGSGCYSPLTRLRFGEVGLRFATSGIYAELIGFRSVNKNISEVIGNTGQQIFINNVATGAEFDGKWRPIDEFTLDLSGVAQHSDLTSVGGSTSFDGNQIDRLPNVAVHLTPTVSTPDGRASAYVTVSYIGKRWGDLANTLQLDAYTDIAAGVSYKITPKVTLSAQGTNLTDRFSITEGNPRGNSVVAGTNPYGFARANLPRTGKITLDVKF